GGGVGAGGRAGGGERVRLVRITSALLAVASAAPGVLAVAGVVHVWHLLVFTFAGGCVRAVQQAARQSYVHDLVGGDGLVGALAVLGIGLRGGGVVGSILGGALTARLGAGAAHPAACG